MGLENLSPLGSRWGLMPDKKHQAMLEAQAAGVTVEDYKDFLGAQARLQAFKSDLDAQLKR